MLWDGLDLLVFGLKRITANIATLLTSSKTLCNLVKKRGAMKRLK
jgi:hypothetical protein